MVNAIESAVANGAAFGRANFSCLVVMVDTGPLFTSWKYVVLTVDSRAYSGGGVRVEQ